MVAPRLFLTFSMITFQKNIVKWEDSEEKRCRADAPSGSHADIRYAIETQDKQEKIFQKICDLYAIMTCLLSQDLLS